MSGVDVSVVLFLRLKQFAAMFARQIQMRAENTNNDSRLQAMLGLEFHVSKPSNHVSVVQPRDRLIQSVPVDFDFLLLEST